MSIYHYICLVSLNLCFLSHVSVTSFPNIFCASPLLPPCLGTIKTEAEEMEDNEHFPKSEKEREIVPKEEAEGASEDGMEEGFDEERTEEDDEEDREGEGDRKSVV